MAGRTQICSDDWKGGIQVRSKNKPDRSLNNNDHSSYWEETVGKTLFNPLQKQSIWIITMDLEKSYKKISFNQDTSCSNNVSISKGIPAFLKKQDGVNAVIICGEIEVTCPSDSFTILD